jgi:hypothetical protein
MIIWHTVKDHTTAPWKLVSYWISQFNVIPGWGTKKTSLHKSPSHFWDHIASYWQDVSSISLHHCTLMMNFCKLWLKEDIQVVFKVGICSLSATFKSLLYRSEVRKSTVHVFHQIPATYTDGSFTRGKPPRNWSWPLTSNECEG